MKNLSRVAGGRKTSRGEVAALEALTGKGDTTMLIWLGKQLLGQRDKHEVETNWPERLGYGGLPIPRRENDVPGADKPN